MKKKLDIIFTVFSFSYLLFIFLLLLSSLLSCHEEIKSEGSLLYLSFIIMTVTFLIFSGIAIAHCTPLEILSGVCIAVFSFSFIFVAFTSDFGSPTISYETTKHLASQMDKDHEFNGYYAPILHKNITRNELETLLKNFHYPARYKLGVFDCSERSAMYEWYLENHGVKAFLLTDSEHMWVGVPIDDELFHIECAGGGTPYILHDSPTDFETHEGINEFIGTIHFSEIDWWKYDWRDDYTLFERSRW